MSLLRPLAAMMALFFGTVPNLAPAAEQVNAVDFVRDVRPILTKHCISCHGPERQRSGLRLDVKSAALKGGDYHAPNIIPGKADASPFMQFIRGKDEEMLMPPKGERLSKAEIATLKAWIDEGANWPDGADTGKVKDLSDHWAFKPVAKVKPPAVGGNKHGDWARNEIDRFILATLESKKLSRAPEADRAVWLRRVYLNLTGLPPTPRQLAAFANDDRPDAHRRVVDELLASPRYGERWAQHWLDVIRYADTHGFEVNTPRDHAWPYRDYVIRAFNEDKRYDQFIMEQLAGDAMEADDATGFLVASAVLLPGQIGQDDASKRLARQDALDEIIIGTSTAFLGLTVSCARCHDHKFDPISHQDYYAMQAFFAGVEYGDRPLNNARRRENLAQAKALLPRIEELQRVINSAQPEAFAGRTLIIDELDTARTTTLKKANGQGTNPPGTSRGYRDDPGAVGRAGNLSKGQYTWWDSKAGEDVLTYNPGVAGRFRLWLSWGVHGSGVHTRDARYLLDRDGDLTTRGDQMELARANQHYFAGQSEGVTELAPLWSGLHDAGVVELNEASKIILRGGETGTGITADAIVLQEELPDGAEEKRGDEKAADGAGREADGGAAGAARLPQLRVPVNAARNEERFAPVSARFVRFTTLATNENNRFEPCLDELEVFAVGTPARNVALASGGAVAVSSGNYVDAGVHHLEHINDGQYGNSRSWISSTFGGGWVQIGWKEATLIDRVIWGRDRTGHYKDRLAVRYRIEVSLDGRTWKQVASDADRLDAGMPHHAEYLLIHSKPVDGGADLPALAAELTRLTQRKAELEKPQLVFAGTFRTPDKTFLLRRGDPEQPAGEVAPAVPVVFSTSPLPANLTEQERRLALAKWIASPDHPLTARVMVNRIWQHHFGVGLVETASDFGNSGTAPSHPELLDWLATQFIESGWSVKHMQRLITLSATYRQSARIDAAAALIDADSRLLWRYPPRRMEAEAIRDSMLLTTGELNLAMGGPGFNFFKSRGGLDGFPPVEQFGPEQMRRMIYSHKVRMESVPIFGAFDCPDAGQPASRRTQSTTAIQALNLFNSSYVIDRSHALAARIKREAPEDVAAQVDAAFEQVLGRKPAKAESELAMATVREHGLMPLCRALFNSSEFLFVP